MLNVLGKGEWANEQWLIRIFSLVDVQMRLLLRGAVTCKVLLNSPALTNLLTPVVFLYLNMLFKLPRWLSRCPPESHLWLQMWLAAFKEIIYLCWFHLCGFAGNQCDEKEGSGGFSRGRRSLQASPEWWIDLQINLAISGSFKPGVSGCWFGFGNWMPNCVVSSSGSSVCVLLVFSVSQCGNTSIKITPFPRRRCCIFIWLSGSFLAFKNLKTEGAHWPIQVLLELFCY